MKVSPRLSLSNQRERKQWNMLGNSAWGEIERAPSASSNAHSEGKELLWQVLQAVRAVDELGAWVTSCQMLKSCQLRMCEEKGGQLLNPRKKRGSLKSYYRWCHVAESKSSMCSVDFTQMDTQYVKHKKIPAFVVITQGLKSADRVKRWLYWSINDGHFQCIQCQVALKPNALSG